ncbi:FAD-dependent monooxygenase [Agromyces protaetiae]|uniref:FAD-dependent monooxygenase n=1 Tax=Agromyces protaetiae TaxID=2509455 RepID=UPI001AA04F2A|nr:FAD-dependent monooxygenase [Agromyces protaetiae]
MRTAIIGAGIGGLCAAIGLQRAGADVTVFERASALEPVGSGLSIFANGLTALDSLGLGDAFREITTTEARQLVGGQRRPDGTWLAKIPDGAVDELRIVHRADLHRLLLGALRPGTVRLGTAVSGVCSDGRTLTTSDGPGRFDVIVAADGIRSKVRASWPADPGIRYSGYSTWRGVTAEPVDLHGEAGETWGHRERFGLAPLADGRIYWFAVASMPADSEIDDEYAEVQRRFGGWHAPIPEIIAATERSTVFRLDINDLAGAVPTFRRGRCVLLGDAAHAMTPTSGRAAVRRWRMLRRSPPCSNASRVTRPPTHPSSMPHSRPTTVCVASAPSRSPGALEPWAPSRTCEVVRVRACETRCCG